MPKKNLLMCALVGVDKFLDQYAGSHGGKKIPCVGCKREVWVSPPTQEVAKTADVICRECGESDPERFSCTAVVFTAESIEEYHKLKQARAETN